MGEQFTKHHHLLRGEIMRRIFCIVGSALFAMIMSVADISACSCAGPGAPCQDYGQASAVFIGTPISVRTAERPATRSIEEIDWTPVTFKFSVEQSFLGVQAREVEVSTGRGGGDCGYGFKLGTRYVVYAYLYSKTNRLTTGICSRTKPLDDAREDLDFLRSLEAQSPGVSIHGRVSRVRQDIPKGGSAPVGPLAGMGLVVEGERERREVLTDDDGRYSLAGLAPGKFKVTLQLPDELSTYKAEQEITVADRGCAAVSYQVFDNGRLSGTVLDPEGQPAARVLVALMDADHADVTQSWGRLEQSDDQGRYSFSGLPPGRYLLALNLNRYPQPNDPTDAYPRTYYPGVTDISKAEIITLGAGENLRDRDLLLPARRAPSVIRGKVVWDDGTPVAKAGISFREVTYHDSRMNNGMDTDDQGYFTIKGYVGQIFIIEARSNRPYSGDPRRFEPMERVEPVRIVLTKPSEVVNIVITRLR
jgi:hypothetical protein